MSSTHEGRSSTAKPSKEEQPLDKHPPCALPVAPIFASTMPCPRWLLWIAVLLCAVDAVIVVRNFCRYIDTWPYYACDDSLVNVSYALATEGRYGFLSNPIQAGSSANRNHYFYNYGPWYFYLGAGLFWLFGYSLSLMRSIHLLGVLAICGVSFWVFRGRVGKLAASLLTVMLMSCFERSHWPMVRPDMMVSVFAAGFIAAAAAAYRRPSGAWWFAAGICAGCGAFTHLIAWALVPVSGAVLIASEWMEPDFPSRRAAWRLLRHAACLAGGGIAAGIMFLASFDFHFRDFALSITNYSTYLEHQQTSPLKAWQMFATMAYEYLSPVERAGFVLAIAASVVAVVILLIGKRVERRAALGLLWPPLAVLIGYGLSVGWYPNYHDGYARLLQTTVIWTTGALIYLLCTSLPVRRPSLRALVTAAAAALAIAVSAPSVKSRLTTPSPRLAKLDEWVPISEYREEVLRQLPRGSTAMGAPIFGDENPGRIQLVVNSTRRDVIDKIKADKDGRLAPAFVLWSTYEQNWFMRFLLERINPQRRQIDSYWVFNHFRFISLADLQSTPRGFDYRLASMVIGAPYGPMRIYEKFPRESEKIERTPSVSLYDPQKKQWLSNLEKPAALEFRPAVASVLRNGPGTEGTQLNSTQTFIGDLPDGVYLVHVRLQSPAPGWLCCHEKSEIDDPLGELETTFDTCEATADETNYYFYRRHSGGSVYLSFFAEGDAKVAIAAASVSKITGLGVTGRRANLITQRLPDWNEWQVDQSTGVTWGERSQELALVKGNDSPFGYQVSSPVIGLPPLAEATLHLAVRAEKGVVAVGLLDGETGQFVVTPLQLRKQTSFHVPKHGKVCVVIANNQPGEKRPASRFTMEAGYIELSDTDNRFYTDRLLDENE